MATRRKMDWDQLRDEPATPESETPSPSEPPPAAAPVRPARPRRPSRTARNYSFPEDVIDLIDLAQEQAWAKGEDPTKSDLVVRAIRAVYGHLATDPPTR